MSRYEESMLNGEHGPAKSYAMEVMARFGDALQAENMVPISSAHASYTSYRLMSKVGIQWLEEVVRLGGHASVPTTTQVASIDMVRWKELAIDPEVFQHQNKICQYHMALGHAATFTCAPYLVGHCPLKGSHIASVESSCIPYMNSIFGARTNRECGQSTILASIIGRTPNAGLHLDENRKGQLLVDVQMDLSTEHDFSLMGYYVGKIAGSRIPVYKGVSSMRMVEARALGAAMATSGAVPMWHCPEVTAESNTLAEAFHDDEPEEVISFTEDDFRLAREELDTAQTDDVEFVDLGCPHYSALDIQHVAKLLSGKKISPNVEFTIWTSQATRQIISRSGVLQIIEAAGGHVYTDTCPFGSKKFRGKVWITNSAKQAAYAPSVSDAQVHIGNLKQCVKAAIDGKWR
ncbi:MAG: aconitase X [Candidatus Ranarchaeia archaeon]